MEDGWTQPIVVTPITDCEDISPYISDISKDFEIVDGFHRWTVSGKQELYVKTDGYVPIVVVIPKDENSQKISTVRHNRARGTHGVLSVSDIVAGLVSDGLSLQEIMQRLGMEKEEVKRLTQRAGIPSEEIFEDLTWSREWNSD